MTRTGTGAAGRHRTTSGHAGARAAGPLATRSVLPLFPSDSGEPGQGPVTASRAARGATADTGGATSAGAGATSAGRTRRCRSRTRGPVTARAGPRPRVATPLVRLAAGLFDAALLVPLDAIVIVLTLRLAELDLQSLDTLPVAPLAGFLILLNGGYVVALTRVGGQTLGKMAFGVRVVNRAGRPVTTSTALVRAVGYLVSVLPLGLGSS